MRIGEMIYNYRKSHGHSMQYVADRCGITKGYVSILEKGINSDGNPIKPSIETISKICKGLHWDINKVFDELDDDYEIVIPADYRLMNDSVELLVEVCDGMTEEEIDKVMDYARLIKMASKK